VVPGTFKYTSQILWKSNHFFNTVIIIILITVLSVIIAANDGQLICCTTYNKCVRVANSFSVWLSDAERREIQSVTNYKIFS